MNANERSTESGRKRKLKNVEAKKNWKIQKLRNGEIRGRPPARCATPEGRCKYIFSSNLYNEIKQKSFSQDTDR